MLISSQRTDMVRLYLDTELNPDFRDLIKALHRMDDHAQYEVVDGRWQDSYEAENTVVFVSDDAGNLINKETLRYYGDGYRVFAWRKPFGKGLDVFRQSLVMLGEWEKILEKIAQESRPFVYGISDIKRDRVKLLCPKKGKVKEQD